MARQNHQRNRKFSLYTKLNKIKDANLKIVQEINNKWVGNNKYNSKNNENKWKKVKNNNKGNNSKGKGKWYWKKTPPKEE